MRSSKADSKTTHNALPKRSSSRGPAPARKESGRSVVQSLATWTSRTVIGLMLIHALSAATSDAATLPFTGTLSATVGDFGSTSVTGSGTGTSVRVGHILDSADIPANVFQTNQSKAVSPPYSGIAGFAVCAPGIKEGTQLAIPSLASACPSPGQNAALSYADGSGLGSIGSSAYLTNKFFDSVGEIPLSVVGNNQSTTGNILQGLVDYTIKGNPWTPSAITSSGVLNGATTVLTATGFDDRSITNSEGTLKLVTSAHITWGGAVAGTTPVIATMTLDFGPPLAASAAAMTLNVVPEPGTALLLGSGIAGLVVLGRRRSGGVESRGDKRL